MKQAGKRHLMPLPSSSGTRKVAHRTMSLHDSNRPPELKLVSVRNPPAAPAQNPQQSKSHSVLYDLGPIGFLSLDNRGRIVDFNQYAAQLFALPGNWLLRCPFIVFVAKHDISRFIQSLMDAPRNNGSTDIEIDLMIEKRLVP